MTTIGKLKEHLSRHYKDDEVIAACIWTISDVLERAKARKIRITMRQAEDILDEMDRKQDASLGITWDTIDAYLDDYRKR